MPNSGGSTRQQGHSPRISTKHTAPSSRNNASSSRFGMALLARPAGVTKTTAPRETDATKHGVTATNTDHVSSMALNIISESSAGATAPLTKRTPVVLPLSTKVDPSGDMRSLWPEVFNVENLFEDAVQKKICTPLVTLVNYSFDQPLLTAAGELIPLEMQEDQDAQDNFLFGTPDNDNDAVSIVCFTGTVSVSRAFLHGTSKALKRLHTVADILPTMIECRAVEVDVFGRFLRYAATGQYSGFRDLLGIACVCDSLGASDMLKPIIKRLESRQRRQAMNFATVMYVYKRTEHREDRKADGRYDLRMFVLRAMHMVLVMHNRPYSAYPRVLCNVGAGNALGVEIYNDFVKIFKRYGKHTVKHPAESFEYELPEKPTQCVPKNAYVQQKLDDLVLLGSID